MNKTLTSKINIHSILWSSFANGPGQRIVIWLQGCSIHCKGCFNPQTHSFKPAHIFDPELLATEIVSRSSGIEGITISGGEPFDQAPALDIFLQTIRSGSDLSVMLLSGYSYSKLVRKKLNREILKKADVLIAGPFVADWRMAQNLAGSSNKTFHFLTARYSMSHFDTIPDAEVIIQSDGSVTFSGIYSVRSNPGARG